MDNPENEKYTWKIVSAEYVPGNETLEEHCKRMGYDSPCHFSDVDSRNVS